MQPLPVPTAPAAAPALLPVDEFVATLPKATLFGAVYFTDGEDRPVQLHAVYSDEHPWQLPGGTAEAGERPWQTAVRETEEETGLVVAGPPRLLAAVFGLPGAAWPLATAGYVFDGGRLSDRQIEELVLDPAEHDEVRVLPLQEWRALMPPRDFVRLTAFAEARRTGSAAYVGTWDWDEPPAAEPLGAAEPAGDTAP
ncbi:NUDIX domain-containing protein [Streptomyces sp. NPDC014861]|uniref:NUDIX domain-containing protein n=1 Tax=Streptomyces sp. NPDC014861 TaxID=3364923 RepID=UPI0036F7C106